MIIEKARKALQKKRESAIEFCEENIQIFSPIVRRKVINALKGENESIDKYQCIFCRKIFESGSGLEIHLRTKHRIKGLQAYWNLFRFNRRSFKHYCRYCGCELTSAFQMFCSAKKCRIEFTNAKNRKEEGTEHSFIDGSKRYSASIRGKTYEEIHGIEKGSERRKRTSESHKGILPTKEARDKQSVTMKKKILNGEWSPNVINSFTHWSAEIIVDGRLFKFRSTWEVEVFEQLKDVYPLSEIEYETLRIPYKYDGVEHIYVVDFYIPLKRLVIEVKPTSSLFDKQEQEKIRVCKEFCKQNNMIFVIFNEKNKYSVREVLDSLGLSEVKKIRISKWTELICGSKQIRLV